MFPRNFNAASALRENLQNERFIFQVSGKKVSDEVGGFFGAPLSSLFSKVRCALLSERKL
jgi:hypothetical protein